VMRWFGTILGTCLALAFVSPAGCSDGEDDQGNKPEPTSRTRDGGGMSCSTLLSPDKKALEFRFSNGVTMKLVLISSGKFMMGSSISPAEMARRHGGNEMIYANNYPQRKVTISKAFYLGVFEVTQAQWRAVMRTEPWKDNEYAKSGAGFPASCVTWDDANRFCKMLSEKTGRKIVLPTEAQWEYACRAGSKTAYYFGDDPSGLGDYAWYYRNTKEIGEGYAHATGQKKPNAWGLYDMHGNVREWCRDSYDKDYYRKAKNVDPENTAETRSRVLRGGSWYAAPDFCRAATRSGHFADGEGYGCRGFRVVVELASGMD